AHAPPRSREPGVYPADHPTARGAYARDCRRAGDVALAQGEVDLVQALTYPLPVIVIAEIIGIPPDDRERFKQWSDVAVQGFGNALFRPPTPERLARLGRLRSEMGAYFSALADERRREPQEDLLTGLVQAELEGSRLSREEML